VLPLGSLPLWGREGVTLTTTIEDFQTTHKLRFSTEQKNGRIYHGTSDGVKR
jgi:hypothetical protein